MRVFERSWGLLSAFGMSGGSFRELLGGLGVVLGGLGALLGAPNTALGGVLGRSQNEGVLCHRTGRPSSPTEELGPHLITKKSPLGINLDRF